MANSFSFDGYDFSTINVLLERGPLELGAPFSQHPTRLARGDGAVAPPSTFGPKALGISCILTAAGAAAVLAALDIFMDKINQLEDAELTFDHIPGRYWMARPIGRPNITPLGNTGARIQMNFQANDPQAYATGAVTEETDTIASTMSSSDSTSFTTGGTSQIYPEIQILLTATSDRWMVSNEDNEEDLLWISPSSAYDLEIGDTLKIQSAIATQLFSVQRAAESAFISFMPGLTGRFPTLNPGMANTLYWWGLTGSVSITYRNRFL